ncbi:MAG: pyridoxal phosphate-dependent aminotransferase [Gemmatimonadota bacterium]|jgi:aspartate aminotransferase|nr:pyridoxal phosphate-dependent aminotransferase [Gemmatimonadota bacterium]
MELSPNIAALQPSATMVVANRAKELAAAGKDIVELTVGEPDFDTPAFVAEAGIQAIRDGRTRYTPAAGINPLRAAVANDLQRLSTRSVEVDPQGVVVSAGAKQALFNVIFSLFGPGDRVIVPVPYWTTYPELIQIARAEPVFVKGPEENSYKISVDDLEAVAARGGVKGLMINSPSNPSGAVYSTSELQAIAEWAAERKVWLVSDEIYRRIYFRGKVAPGVLDLPSELLERVVVVDGASKAFAMTGWRLGFSYSSKAVASKLSALQSQTTSNVSTPTQYAALAAYQREDEADREVERMRAAFENRKNVLAAELKSRLPDVSYVEPEGAFYFFINTKNLARPGENSLDFCERLLVDANVAVVPGAAFGDDSYFRLSFASPESALVEAVRRIAATR